MLNCLCPGGVRPHFSITAALRFTRKRPIEKRKFPDRPTERSSQWAFQLKREIISPPGACNGHHVMLSLSNRTSSMFSYPLLLLARTVAQPTEICLPRHSNPSLCGVFITERVCLILLLCEWRHSECKRERPLATRKHFSEGNERWGHF